MACKCKKFISVKGHKRCAKRTPTGCKPKRRGHRKSR